MTKYTTRGLPWPEATDKIAKTGGIEESLRKDIESLALAVDREVTAVDSMATTTSLRVGVDLADNRALVQQAVYDSATSLAEAQAAAGLVGAPAGSAVLAAVSPGGAAYDSLLTTIDDRVTRRSEYLIDVKDYGAVGDESASDSAAINTAIAAATASGLDLFVPDGRYKLTEPLRSAGGGLTMRLAPGATLVRHFLHSMFVNGPDQSAFGGHSDLTFDGGTWDANGLNFPDWGSIFCFGRASRIRVQNTTLKNVCKSHIMELAGVQDFRGKNITFSGYHDPTGTRDYAEAFQIERMTKAGFPSFNIDDRTPCADIVFDDCQQITPDPGYARWPVGLGGHAMDTDGVMNSNIMVRDCDFGFCTKYVARIQNVKNVTLDRVRGSAPIGVVVEGNGIIADHQTLLRGCDILSTSSHGLLLDKVHGVKIDGGTIDGKTNAVFLSNASGLNLTGRVTLIAQTFDAIVVSGVAGSPASADINLNGVRILKARIGFGKVDPYAEGMVMTLTDVSVDEITNHFMNVPKNARVRAANMEIKKMPNGNRVFNFGTGSPAIVAATNTLYPPNVTTFSNPVTGEHEMLSQNVMKSLV